MYYKKILCGAAFALCGALFCVLEKGYAIPDSKTATLKIKSTVEAKVHLDVNGVEGKELSLTDLDGIPYKEFSAENSWFFSQNGRKQKYTYKITAPHGWKLTKNGAPSEVSFGCKVGTGQYGKDNEKTHSKNMTTAEAITLNENHKLGITAVISESRLTSGVWAAELQLEITSDD